MKKVLLVAPVVLAIVGCGQSSKMENAIKDRLRDPASAQFKQVVISDFGNFACVEWNAKNGMGGYGDWSIAELKKVDSDWVVTEMEGKAYRCTPEELKSKERHALTMKCIADIANRDNNDECISKFEKLQ